jgi:hypothetical protein
MKYRLMPLMTLFLLAAACASAPISGPPPAPAESPAKRLDRLFDSHWEATLELNPVMATFIGDHRYNDRFTVTISPAHPGVA